jgi:hypothetical protein
MEAWAIQAHRMEPVKSTGSLPNFMSQPQDFSSPKRSASEALGEISSLMKSALARLPSPLTHPNHFSGIRMFVESF